jgi:serine/threonine protein kinase
MAAEDAQQPTDLESGEVLNGAWRLEEQIGEGGMGRVFRATDLKLARKAAIKALSVHNLDEETVKRFEREAQVMGKLDHPGVVTLYGVGRTRGVPWLAMKHLEGQSLWGVLDDNGGALTPAVLLPIARQLLVALGYIHERGLLHRDLKPSNIHVGTQGKVTLLDLGLARGHKSKLTRTGVIWGTPDYMAPEQIVGERQLDGRADLYALSVVLYRMLSGTSPFPEEDEHELMRAHLMNPRPDISRVVPACSPLLGVALQKGLAIRPEDRFQTADEMLAALERAMLAPARDAPTTARPSAPVPVGRRRTGEIPASSDPGPKTGVKRTSTPGYKRPEVATDPAMQGLALGGEGSSGPTMVVTEPAVSAMRRSVLQDDDDDDGARTQREGFRPVSQETVVEGVSPVSTNRTQPLPNMESDSGPTDPTDAPEPREQRTAPSEPFARPLKAAPPEEVSGSAAAPLPGYLSPGFLIGAAVVLLIVGVLLGKFL